MWPEITASGKQLDSLKPFVCQPVLTGVISFLFLLISFHLTIISPPPCHPVLSIFSFLVFYPSHNTHFLHYLCMLDDFCFYTGSLVLGTEVK